METLEAQPASETGAPPMDHATTEIDARPAPSKQARKQQSQRRPGNGGDALAESVGNEMVGGDAIAVREWLIGLAGDAEVKVNLLRKKPSIGPNGEPIGGSLESVEELIDDDYIREKWGGGTYGIAVMTRRSNGQFKLVGRTQLVLAGPPKINGVELTPNSNRPPVAAIAVEPESSPLVERAFESMERREREAQERLVRQAAEGGRGNLDAGVLQALMAPISQQLAEAQATIRDLQRQAIDASTRQPPTDPFRDQLMGRLFDTEKQAVDTLRAQYEARIDALRERYEGRIDRMIEEHAKDKQRILEAHRDEMRSLEKRHEREIDMFSKHTGSGNDLTKAAYEMQLANLKETITRQERELGAKDTKIAALEARKDQTLMEKAEEIQKIQEVMENFGGGGDKDEKWYERLIGAVGNSEVALNWINKLTGGNPAEQQLAAQQMQQQLPPPGVPFRGQDGQVYIHDGHGNVMFAQQPMPTRKKKKKKQQAAAAEGGDDTMPTPEDVDEFGEQQPAPPANVKPPSPEDLSRALSFIDTALKGKDPNPEILARSAMSMLSEDVLAYVRSFPDADALLATVKIPPGSQLTTVKGRQFIRAVHKYLRDGAI